MRLETAKYHLLDGSDLEVEYDADAPCHLCLQPVVAASMGGTDVCPWCDMGKCRACGVDLFAFGEHIDGGSSLRRYREHVAHCIDIHEKAARP